jgi:hypothetical protein
MSAQQQQQQQQLTVRKQHGSSQQKCRITFATISSLQARPDASDIKQAQQALANTVMAGLQLAGLQQQSNAPQQQQNSAQHHQQQHHAPLAWLQLQLPGSPPSTASSGSQPDNRQQNEARRFPFIGREQQQQQQQRVAGSTSSSSSRPAPDRNKLRTRGSDENPASAPGMVCLETDAGGRQRVYNIRRGVDKHNGRPWEGFDMVRR